MNNKSRGSPSKFKRAEKIFAFLIIMVVSIFIGKSVSYARTHGDYTYYPRTDGYYYIRVKSPDGSSQGLYKVTVNIGDRASGTNSYYVDYSMSLISGTDQGISLRKNRFFTYCDLTPEDLILLDFDEVERQYYLPNWLDFNKTGYTLSAVSNAGTVQTYVKEVGTNYTYYIVDTNGTGITTWNPSHPGEWHDTIRLQYKPIQYKMTVRHWAYNLNTGQFDIDLGTQIEYADYDSVYTPPYSKTPTGYYNYSRGWDKGWTVTGDGIFDVYYYPANYNQTMHWYYYYAKGSYDNPGHDWGYLGDKVYSQTYGTWFDAAGKWNDWGNVAGYHYWCMNSNGWTVTGEGETNAHYYPNKYRVNVDVNGGSGTNGNFDMEYGTSIDLGTPTRTGWKFTGWTKIYDNSTNSTLSGNQFVMGYSNTYPYQDYMTEPSVKIIANWQDATTPNAGDTILKATNPAKTI